jgi:hypothetical protein
MIREQLINIIAFDELIVDLWLLLLNVKDISIQVIIILPNAPPNSVLVLDES